MLKTDWSKQYLGFQTLGQRPFQHFMSLDKFFFSFTTFSIILISFHRDRDFTSKKISNDQELIQSDPTSCPQNQKRNN